MLRLKSNDDKLFSVDREVLKRSGTISTMLDVLPSANADDDDDADNQAEPVPLPNVSGQVLELVIQWITKHKEDPLPPEEEDPTTAYARTDDIPEWDVAFFKEMTLGGPRLDGYDHRCLFELVLAANYLEIKDLRTAICKTVANMIKGKTAEEIRTMWNIKSDFTKEEEEEVRKENEWCDD